LKTQYVETITRAFLEKVGRGLMLSPKDYRLLDRWYRAGIPSEVVVAAIDTAFDTPVSRRIHSLSFVAQSLNRQHPPGVHVRQARHLMG